MSPESTPSSESPKKHRPYVPENMEMKEFTLRAVLLGLVLTVRALRMPTSACARESLSRPRIRRPLLHVVLRAWRSLLEESIARTAGSIGEGLAAAVLLPRFLLS